MKITIEKRERTWRRHTQPREFHARARVYIFAEGESILANLVNRTTRPHKVYRDRVLPTVYAYLGLDPREYKMRWSKHAGCSMCPCSPGFIIEGQHRYDVFVTVSDLPETTGGEERDRRAAALGITEETTQ